MRQLFVAFALLTFLPFAAQAATIESVLLPKNLNQGLRGLEFNYSMHTERIEQDRLGSQDIVVNPFRNVETMIFANNLQDTPTGKQVLGFIRNANAMYKATGFYCVFGRKDGTEALNRLGYYERQSAFRRCGL